MHSTGAAPLICCCQRGTHRCRAHRAIKLGIGDHVANAGHTITLQQYQRIAANLDG